MGPRSVWGAVGAVLVSWAVSGGASAADTQGQVCPPPIVRTDEELKKARRAVERIEEQLQDVRLKQLRTPHKKYAEQISRLQRELANAKAEYDLIAKERDLYDRLLASCDKDDEKPAPRPQAATGGGSPQSQLPGGQGPGSGPAPKPGAGAPGKPDPQTPASGDKPAAPGNSSQPKPAPNESASPPGSVPASFTPELVGFVDADTSIACTFGGASVPLFIGPNGLGGPSTLTASSTPSSDATAGASNVSSPPVRRRFNVLSGYALELGLTAGPPPSAREALLKEVGLPEMPPDDPAVPDRMALAGLDGATRRVVDAYVPAYRRPFAILDIGPELRRGRGSRPTTGEADPPVRPPAVSPPSTPPSLRQAAEAYSGVPIIFKAHQSVIANGQTTHTPLPSAQLMINFSAVPPLPGQGARDVDSGADQPPIRLVTDTSGEATTLATGRLLPRSSGYDSLPLTNRFSQSFPFSPPPPTIHLDVTPRRSLNVAFSTQPPLEAGTPSRFRDSFQFHWLDPLLQNLVTDSFRIGDTPVVSLNYLGHQEEMVQNALARSQNVLFSEVNRCVTIQGAPNDPMFQSKSSWKQPYDDQWAIKRVGFTSAPGSAWDMAKGTRPIVVAVIDTGLDWNHEDIAWESLWSNPKEIAANGVDDDENGFVDDTLGWDFWRKTNLPWDRNGHGTFVAGIIAATSGNGIGIAGINPQAKIMVIKALNSFGHGRASHLAQSIVYAVDNGAQVVNISVGGKGRTRTEQLAVEYAHRKGVVIVVSAGNEGTSDEFGPGGMDQVITVGATDLNDKRSIYSNWGPRLDIAAPGDDVLGPRARLTDLMLGIPGIEYKEGDAIVGATKRYYRASGTSFAAPIVAGIASLIEGQRPGITPDQVKRMIVHSARDLDVAGVDQYTGYGLVDAVAALGASPDFFVEAGIAAVTATQKSGRTYVQVTGTADADALKGAWIEIGAGESPTEWKKVSRTLDRPVRAGVLDEIEADAFRASKKWTLRLVTEHKKGQRREARFLLNLG
jgi:subtilisin family serine protease